MTYPLVLSVLLGTALVFSIASSIGFALLAWFVLVALVSA